MISVVMKANVFAIFYLLFIFKIILSRGKTEVLVKLISYMAICFVLQYFLFLLNLTDHTSPSPYPVQFEGYPKNKNPHDFTIKYSVPVFFRYPAFRNMRLCYLLGIGVESA
jgi:hypothetical protein